MNLIVDISFGGTAWVRARSKLRCRCMLLGDLVIEKPHNRSNLAKITSSGILLRTMAKTLF